MTIQFNTDHNIEGNERLAAFTEETVTNSLSRFNDHITRLEIHLSDDNAGKNGSNKMKCVLEARLEGLEPVAVTAHETTTAQAVNSALDKLKAALDTILGRLKNH